ncbi:uncharacterized protein I303_105920 [Kwoniella dejecticola CBS 10117]|uniref:3-carboxymuconate cyclase n=1 Tax=Kwoniella dejecticola CBS 10117 TaxID=1296121 RepID=A0A1A6A0T5_9TREE|nr:uncharacterized protein I303_05943 [Kwoniella dejecticola CBS 10117]OBR83663.1 hypothetical protein I303_05943 [Kwoniella dejecticola CBS 10117]
MFSLRITFPLLASLAFLLGASAWGSDYKGALYTLSQEFNQAILISALHPNGTAEFVSSFQTGGKGAGARGQDALQSSDSLLVHENLLFAVNSASDELSLFHIDPKEPWNIQQIGNNTWSGGKYPTSIAVSPDSTKACVANAGSQSYIRCFNIRETGLELMSSFRYDLELGQTDPPVGPPKTPSDLSFTADGQILFVTVKGSANASEAPAGRIELFDVSSDSVSHKSTVYAASGPGGLPFSITPIADSAAYLVTDPAGGADIIRIERDGSVSYNTSITIPGQAATCWSAYSPVTDQYFTIDLATAIITPMTINSTTLEATLLPGYNITTSSGNPGSLVDSRIAHFSDQQDYLYSLVAGDQTVRVFSLPAGSQSGIFDLVQTYELGAAYNSTGGAVGTSIEGLAVFVRTWW